VCGASGHVMVMVYPVSFGLNHQLGRFVNTLTVSTSRMNGNNSFAVHKVDLLFSSYRL
jgi:hypothetical protein